MQWIGKAPAITCDVDHYEKRLPLDTIPPGWKEAVAKYGQDTLSAHGIVPWHIKKVTWQLTNAFVTQDLSLIIRLSADLGHYVGDLHVPLHTTANYNGQLTGQHGIHGLWESRLVENCMRGSMIFLPAKLYTSTMCRTLFGRLWSPVIQWLILFC